MSLERESHLMIRLAAIRNDTDHIAFMVRVIFAAVMVTFCLVLLLAFKVL